jgi:hypothetical protein
MTRAQRYMAMLENRPDKLDNFYYAAFYLMSSDEMLSEQLYPYISHEGIDFPAMMEQCTGIDDRQRQMLSIAQNLFTCKSACEVTPSDIAGFGYPVLNNVCDAICVASGQARPQIQVNDSGEQVLVLDKSKGEQTKKIYDMLSGMQNTAFEDDAGIER